MHHYDRLLTVIQVCLIVAAVCTTLFPLIWACFPWYRRVFGRLFMLQGVSFAIVLDLTALFQFWQPTSLLTQFWISASVFVLIAISSALLSFSLLYIIYRERKPKRRNHDRHLRDSGRPEPDEAGS